MTPTTDTRHNGPDPTATGSVREITEASREMFQAGERLASNLDTFERRVEHATDWRAQFEERPWLLLGGAVLGGFLLWRILR